MTNLACVLGSLLAAFAFQEERVDDSDYDKNAAAHVKAVEAVERNWRKDPAAALKAIEPALKAMEAEMAPRLPHLIEASFAVKITRGIDKGEIRERHAFFPYRLAGEIALAAGEPERAVELLQKSPTGATLLAEARKAVAAKTKKDPTPPPPPAPPAAKPALDLRPILERKDFSGALEAVRGAADLAVPDRERMTEDVRREAGKHQRERIALLAAALPRIDQPEFRKEHVEPCLQSCARVSPELETEELRWVRRLDRWFEKRELGEFERLAVAATRFGADFNVLCDKAQDDRIREIERLVQEVNQAERSERPKLLDRLGEHERGLTELLTTRDRPGPKEKLAALKARLPLDDQALQRARDGAFAIADIRRIADELDRLWVSERRSRLSLPDQKELALRLGTYRCLSLFLDGRSIDEAAQDPRIREVFRTPGELPPDISPKVAAVRARLN